MDRNTHLVALDALTTMLGRSATNEDCCQAWFEHHRDLVFACLGYQTVIPHPILETNDERYIPDFIAQGPDGLWQIFEIKTPRTPVLKKRTRRVQFYSEMDSYISQCCEYCEFFDDAANRDRFNQRYGFCPQKNINAALVAGRSAGLDKYTVFTLLSRRSNRVTHVTYDDIKTYVEFDRARIFSGAENLPGLSLHFVLIPKKMERSGFNFLVDIGANPTADRVSVLIDEKDRFVLRVIDTDGETWLTRASIKEHDIAYEKVMVLSLEIGLARTHSVMSIELDGKYLSDCKLAQFALNIAPDAIVVGSDMNGASPSRMDMMEFVAYDRTLGFNEREKLRGYLWHIVKAYRAGGKKPRLCFEEMDFMYTRAHPNFGAPPGTGGARDLVQTEETLRPRVKL